MMKQIETPVTVGNKNARAVQLRLPVSFFTVRHVVPQGKWNKHNITTDIAV